MAGPGFASSFDESSSAAEARERARSTSPHRTVSDQLERLSRRMSVVEDEGRDLFRIHDRDVAPLIALLDERTLGDRPLVERTALALVREGRSNGVDPRLLAAVVLVENPWLDPVARSPVGAVGLMQVMPFHAGQWGCGGDDLEHPETNICHGTKILAHQLRRTRNLHTALLRYNGCVLGTNTPDCHQYPSWVYSRAGSRWMAEIHIGLWQNIDEPAG